MGVSLAALLLVLGGSASAQGQAAPPEGARLRITPADRVTARWIGVVHHVGPDTLVVVGGTGPVDLVRGATARLEISRGRHSSLPATVLGFFGGAALGGFGLGCLANRDDYGVLCGGQHDTRLVVGAGLGGLLGAFVAQALSRRERWQPWNWP
ncbi:MAG: hypothetical protein V4503_09795 [Gemmatimonadota bacterium]